MYPEVTRVYVIPDGLGKIATLISTNVCGTLAKISVHAPTLPDPIHAHAHRSGQDKIATLTLTSACTHRVIIMATVTTSREATSVPVRMAGRDKTVMSVRASLFSFVT